MLLSQILRGNALSPLPLLFYSLSFLKKRKNMNEETKELNQWQEWNKQGFLPGPEESQEAFQERVAFCQNLEQHLVQIVGANLPFDVSDQHSQKVLEEVLPFTQKLYGIQPQWVPLFFSNYHLSPWHGGCAWIFQLNAQTPTAAFLQLRARFRNSLTFLGLYQRHELIAHELAHVGRMLYQEPKFEEILAYQSSSSSWRCWLGPIVQSSKESLFFILLLGVIIMTDFALLSLGPQMIILAWWMKLLPVVLIVLGLSRLIYRHRLLQHCLQHLEALYSSQQARHVLYRLLDSEIKQFSHLSPLAIQAFIDQAATQSFRWRFLKALYPSSKEL